MIAGVPFAAYALIATLAALSVEATAQEVTAPSAIAIPFAPPLDQPLLYRIVQVWPTGDRNEQYSILRELHFERAGDGYSLTVVLRDVSSDAPPARALRLRAALAPLLNVPLHFRLDASGAITGLDDFDAIWAIVTAGQRTMLESFGADRSQRAVAQAVFDALGKMDRTQRLAILTGDIAPLFQFSGSHQITNDASDADSIAMAETPAPGIAVHYRISRRTGLVLWQEKQVDAYGRSLHEIRTLEFPTP